MSEEEQNQTSEKWLRNENKSRLSEIEEQLDIITDDTSDPSVEKKCQEMKMNTSTAKSLINGDEILLGEDINDVITELQIEKNNLWYKAMSESTVQTLLKFREELIGCEVKWGDSPIERTISAIQSKLRAIKKGYYDGMLEGMDVYMLEKDLEDAEHILAKFTDKNPQEEKEEIPNE